MQSPYRLLMSKFISGYAINKMAKVQGAPPPEPHTCTHLPEVALTLCKTGRFTKLPVHPQRLWVCSQYLHWASYSSTRGGRHEQWPACIPSPSIRREGGSVGGAWSHRPRSQVARIKIREMWETITGYMVALPLVSLILLVCDLFMVLLKIKDLLFHLPYHCQWYVTICHIPKKYVKPVAVPHTFSQW